MLTGGALAAGDHLGALLDGVGDVRLDLLDRLHVDQGPITAPGSNPAATFIATVIRLARTSHDTVLHRDAAGAHAGVISIRWLSALNCSQPNCAMR